MENNITVNYDEIENLAYLQNIFDSIVIYSSFIGAFSELSVLIFLFHSFKNKTSTFSSTYFHLLSIGYFLDLFCFIPSILKTILSYDDTPITVFIKKFLEGYMLFFIGPWNIALCLNRLTSIALDNKHQILWSTKNFYFLLVFIFAFPFIVNSGGFFNLSCMTAVSSMEECYDFVEQQFYFISVCNGICASISLVLGVTTFIILSQKHKQYATSIMQIKHSKIERNLLSQSFISSVLYGSFCISMAIYPYFLYHSYDSPSNFIVFSIIIFLQNIFYMSFHYSSFISLFIFSPTLRTQLLDFYHLHHLFTRRRQNVSSIIFLTTK